MLDRLQFGLFQLFARFHRDDEGAALVEYGMLVGLIAVVCLAAVQLLGGQINGVFTAITAALTLAGIAPPA